MFHSENHSNGFRNCSPLAGALHALSAWGFIAGLFLALISAGLLIMKWIGVTVIPTYPRIVLLPVLLLVLAVAMNLAGKYVVYKKGFNYDYESDCCTWSGGHYPC